MQQRNLNFLTDAYKISDARILCHAVLSGDQETQGEGRWLPGVLIRCRSAEEHQTIKSRVCSNRTPSSGLEWAEMDSGFIERSYRMTAKSHYLLIKY